MLGWESTPTMPEDFGWVAYAPYTGDEYLGTDQYNTAEPAG